MKNPIARTRKFVDDNRTQLAFVGGAATAVGTMLFLTKDKTVLTFHNSAHDLLRAGGGVVFNLKGQTLHLVNLEAVEAAQNLT